MHALHLALVVALCAAARGGVAPTSGRLLQGFQLDEVLDATYRARGLGAIWTGDNRLAKFNSTTNEIQICDPNPLKCDVFVNNKTLDGDGRLSNIGSWALSSDMKLLLWSYNVKAGFRHSTLAQYAVLQIESQKWQLLEEGSHLQIAQLAPTGTAVAYVMDNRIYYIPDILTSSNGKQITPDSDENVYYGVPDWVYEEEVLSSGSAMWISKQGSFMAFGIFNDTEVELFDYIIYGEDQYTKVESLKYPKPGTSNPVVSLKIVNLQTLSKDWFDLEPPFEESILQTVAWVSDTDVVVVWMSRIQNKAEIQCYSKQANGPWNLKVVLADEETGGWLEIGTPVAVINNSSWVQLLPRRNGTERFQRPTVFMNQNLTQHPDRIHDKSVATALYGWDEASDRIFFQAAPEGKPGQRHVYSTTASGETPEVICLTCDVVFWEGEKCSYASAAFSKDLTRAAVTCSGPGPAVVRLAQVLRNGTLNWGQNWEENKDLRKKLELRSHPQVESVVFSVADTQAQVKLWLPPNVVKDGSIKYPLLVFVYGGPGSQQVSEAFSINWGTYLATSRNIIYAFIDGRGSGFQGSKTLYALYKKLGTVEIEDQISVTRQLETKFPFIDSNRVGIWGWSYGGYATAMTLARDNENVFKCGASVAPVTSWDLYDSIYTERYMDKPQNNTKGYEEASVLTKAAAFANKTFYLIHGNADDNVHYQQAMRLARELELKNVLFSSQSYPDENHSIRSVINHVYNSLDNFFNECFAVENASPALIPSLLSTLIFAIGVRIFM